MEKNISESEGVNVSVKSLRCLLIETIVNKIILNNVFEPLNNTQILIQNELDKHLKFETKVSEVLEKNKFQVADIQFQDENGVARVINLTILTTGSLV